MKNTLRTSALLSAAGGFLDSFAYVAHGHVFTNAQTGNIILCAVSAAQGSWPQALRHLPPIAAFFAGIFAARWLGTPPPPWPGGSPAVLSLCAEIMILAVIGLLPRGFPDLPVVFGIAFAAALQNSSFERVGKWSYTSVVTTGNLRTAAEAFFAGVFPGRDAEAHQKAKVFATICAAFASGATMGAVLTVAFEPVATVVPIILLVAALLSCLREARRPPAAGMTPASAGPTES